MAEKPPNTSLNTEKINDYIHYVVWPLKLVACWDWYPNPTQLYQDMINNIHLALVLFVLVHTPIALFVHLYIEWVDVMSSLKTIADGLPPVVSTAIVAYFGMFKKDLYELVDYMNSNFKYHSARGLTNMTMLKSYANAKRFAHVYTASTISSVSIYVFLPVFLHLWTKEPLQPWIYTNADHSPFFEMVFLRQCLVQAFIGLAMGQLGVFFASNAILICGQLDLLCCTARNVRFTALLSNGVRHDCLRKQFSMIQDDEEHSYLYNVAEIKDSVYHYDRKVDMSSVNKKTHYDIYSPEYDAATDEALAECARMNQIVQRYIELFERFVSPLVAVRVVQVTLYMCTLLYAATEKFDLITGEYLMAVALDIFIYCYFGHQITLQTDNVSMALYQSNWPSMGGKTRRMLLNCLLSTKRATDVRAARFLPMNLHTYIAIVKNSFSYYTLLVNVNERKKG